MHTFQTPTVTPLKTPAFDPDHGTGQTITLSQSVLDHEQDVYEADPTGGAASRY